jgi:hypothetical protein
VRIKQWGEVKIKIATQPALVPTFTTNVKVGQPRESRDATSLPTFGPTFRVFAEAAVQRSLRMKTPVLSLQKAERQGRRGTLQE